MRVWYFSEMAYHPAWEQGLKGGSLRVVLPNRNFDPKVGHRLLNRYLDEFALCDEVGLDIMVNEHHSTSTCLTVSVPMALAIIARETKRSRLLSLGTPIANRPDPVRVAEEMAWLDVLSGGRLEMGLVKGAPYEIAPANSNPANLMRRYWEAHDLILKAMSTTDGPFNWEGEFFHYRNVNIWPRPYQQPTPPVWMTGLSPETGRMAAEHGHIVGTLLSLSAAGPMFEAYRKRAQELGWTAGTDRFAYAAVVGVGATREEGLRRANLAADYVRTSPVVAEAFTNPPGYNSLSANVAMLKAGGKRGGFVRDRHGNPVEQTTASIEQLIESGTCFAGTPDDVYDQIKALSDSVGGFGHLLMMAKAVSWTIKIRSRTSPSLQRKSCRDCENSIRSQGKLPLRRSRECRMADTEFIPVIDLGPYLAGTPGAIDRTAGELRFALTEIGFYFIVNHGVPSGQIRDIFRQVARFHAQPLEKKLEIKLNKHNVGYLPMKGDTLRTSTVETVTKPNLNEALFVARDLPSDHPDVLADRRFRSANRWPSDLPGFREVIVDYCDTMERLAQKLVRLYARALDLPTEFFDQPFKEPQYKLRMTHYPQQADALDDEFGIAPHTDTSFLTLLAPNEVPGLSIRTQSGKWIDAPAIPDAYVVNGGQLLQRCTNDYFLATPHRAVNRSGGERYALAFFCDGNIDWPVAAVPTCVGPDKPPKYPTTYYTDYMIRYQQRTYNVFGTEKKDAAE